MRVLPYGERAVLVEVGDHHEAAAWRRALDGAPGVVELVPAARTLLVVGRDAAQARAAVLAAQPAPGQAPEGPTVEVPVVYDGQDLAHVADATGLGVAEVVRRHSQATYEVSFGGFLPGFAYLTGLDPALHLPRLSTPRSRVPAGSVAVAGAWSAVYPRSSPGGWNLLGRTDLVLFDPDRDPPALLTAGVRVRFVPRAG